MTQNYNCPRARGYIYKLLRSFSVFRLFRGDGNAISSVTTHDMPKHEKEKPCGWDPQRKQFNIQ